jgi:hypothetical protein
MVNWDGREEIISTEITAFCVIAPCSLVEVDRRFEGT